MYRDVEVTLPGHEAFWQQSPSGLRLVLCTQVVPDRFSDMTGKTSWGHLNEGREAFCSKQSLCYIGIIIDRIQLLKLVSDNNRLWSTYSQWSSLRENVLRLWILNLGSSSEDLGSTPTMSAHVTLAYFITFLPSNTEPSQNSDSELIKSTAGYLWSTSRTPNTVDTAGGIGDHLCLGTTDK